MHNLYFRAKWMATRYGIGDGRPEIKILASYLEVLSPRFLWDRQNIFGTKLQFPDPVLKSSIHCLESNGMSDAPKMYPLSVQPHKSIYD